MKKIFGLLFCSGLLFYLSAEIEGMKAKKKPANNTSLSMPTAQDDINTLENTNAELLIKITNLEAKMEQNGGYLESRDAGNLRKYRQQYTQNEKRIKELNARMEKGRQRLEKDNENWEQQQSQRSIEDLRRETASLVAQAQAIFDKGDNATEDEIEHAMGLMDIVDANKKQIKNMQKRTAGLKNKKLNDLGRRLHGDE